MGDRNNVESTTSVQPWSKASNELNELIDTAQGAFKSGGLTVQPYEGQRVAPLSAMTQQGANLMGNLGYSMPAGTWDALGQNLDFNGTLQQLSNIRKDILSDDQMYRDFDTIRNTVGDATKAQLASTFAGGGINSGLAQDTYSRAMGEALAGVEYDAYNQAQQRQLQDLGMAYGAYGNARGNQLQALGMAPQLAFTSQGLQKNAAAGKLAGGGMYDQYNQSLINADMQKWNENQMKDIDALSRYSGLLTPLGGMGSTSTMTESGAGGNPLGAVATGLGTYGTLAGMSAIGGPLAIAGGVLAGLGSL